MTPPLFLVPELRPGRLIVTGEEGHHASAVRRVRPGERVDLTDGAGTLGRAEVVSTERSTVTVEVLDVALEPRSGPLLTVVQALLKGEAGERAVGLLTQVGVDRILPWTAARSVARWDAERSQRGMRRWRAAAREAAKQAHRAWFPDVADPASTKQVAGSLAEADWAGCLHPPAGAPLSGCHVPEAAAETVLIVGPEGGLTEEEVDAFAAVGAPAYRLGTEVLRGETAGMAAAAVLNVRTGRW
jgi:16S rRNA (uracil1498-N3)-methyltransferase